MTESSSRGATWLAALTENAAPVAGYPASVRVVDAELADQPCRYIAVLPDESNPYPRARSGEVGLIEGWALAKAVHEAIDVPVKFIGVGETPEDIEAFDPAAFVEALFAE